MRGYLSILACIVVILATLGCGKTEPQKATAKPTAETKVAQAAIPKEDPCTLLKQFLDEASIIVTNTKGDDLQRRIGDLKIEITKKSSNWSDEDKQRVTLAKDYLEAISEAFRMLHTSNTGTSEDIKRIRLSGVYNQKADLLRSQMLKGCK
jgi:hypothetical protein